MAIIKYFDGLKHVEIEVSEEFAKEYAEIEHREKLVERKETRRHQSLDKSLEHGWDIPDLRIDIQADIERNEENLRLHNAIERLSSTQRQLLEEVYFNGVSQAEIAKREGVGKTAINNRLSRILARLKNFLE